MAGIDPTRVTVFARRHPPTVLAKTAPETHPVCLQITGQVVNTRASDLEATSLALLSLGGLLSNGYDPEQDHWVKEVPMLAVAVSGVDWTRSEWAAETHRVFIREVHPYANVFLSSDAQMGGLRTQWVHEDLSKMGLSIQGSAEEPDHLGHLILTLGHLVGAEQDAVEDDAIEAAVGLAALQAAWIDQHISPWLHILRQATRQQEPTLYNELLALITELICTRRRRISVPYAPQHPFVLPPLIADLDRPQTDMRLIATQLTTPALSGWYLSRGWLSLTGTQLDLPCGFGSRRLMMENLLHTAIDHRAMPKLCAHFLQVVDGWSQPLKEAAERPCPGWRVVSEVWRLRLESTRQLLMRLAKASENVFPH
jgi:TorA maturation chaperone TorD